MNNDVNIIPFDMITQYLADCIWNYNYFMLQDFDTKKFVLQEVCSAEKITEHTFYSYLKSAACMCPA